MFSVRWIHPKVFSMDIWRDCSLNIFCETEPFAINIDEATGFSSSEGPGDCSNYFWRKSVGVFARFSGLITSIKRRKSAKSCLSG